MFHLPIDIIQLIFEFDPTYKEEYKKVLRILNNFPAYYKYEPKLAFEPYLYMFNFPQYPMPHYYPPNKYYFYILRRHFPLICKY